MALNGAVCLDKTHIFGGLIWICLDKFHYLCEGL